MRAGPAAATIALALIATSCGSDRSSSEEMVRTGQRAPAQASDGRLESNPDPLTLRDVARQPRGSARATVVEVLFWAQWGNLPAIVDRYTRQVVTEVGVPRFTGAWAWLRPQTASSLYRIVLVRRNGARTFVGLESATTSGPKAREAFVLRRVAGRWRVAYDTMLDRGLEGHVTAITPDSSRGRPNGAAQRAGKRAAQAYRNVEAAVAFTRGASG